MLEFGEEILDEMTGFIQVFVVYARVFSVGFWRDDNLYSGSFKRFYDTFIGVKSFTGKNGLCRYVREESIRAFKITSLSRCNDEIDRVAKGIGESVDFGRQSAF